MTSATSGPGQTQLRGPLRDFLVDQIGRLDRFDFLAVSSPAMPFFAIEVGRNDAGSLEVRVPPRLPSTPLPLPKRARLVDAGFRSEDPAEPLEPWVIAAADPDEAVDVAATTLREVFDIGIDADVNVLHGSHRAEYEAEQKLEQLRQHVETLLTEFIGHTPEQDIDGDFIYPTDHLQVIVVPRVVPGAFAVVRVIAITNAEVSVTPELGLFLARLNFGLVFGRFVLDARHQAIWFDESLLGENLTREELHFTVMTVAQTAAEWAGRLQQMFGGYVHGGSMAVDEGSEKPGTGGYL